MSVNDDLLGLMRLYVSIADAGSIAAAARILNVTQPTASRGLKRLEDRLGVRLIERTTASFSLTEAGLQFLEDARLTTDAAKAAEERVRDESAALEGEVTLAANEGIGATILQPLLAAFQSEHPGLTLHLVLTEDPVAMVREGIDIWIRVGPIPDESLIVRSLLTVERPIIASPDVSLSDTATESEIAALPWIGFDPFYTDAVRLVGPDGVVREMPISPRLSVDSVFALKAALTSGSRVALLPEFLVSDELAAKRLKRLETGFQGEPAAWRMAFKPGKYRPARVQRLADALSQGLKQSVAAI